MDPLHRTINVSITVAELRQVKVTVARPLFYFIIIFVRCESEKLFLTFEHLCFILNEKHLCVIENTKSPSEKSVFS